jgi:hypothetical protein
VSSARAPAGLTFRAAVAALFLFAIANCGGGGSTPATGTIVPVTPRAGLHMGYYWGCRDFLIEQQSHIDTWFAAGQCSSEPNAPWWMRIAQELATARGAGVKHIILKPDTLEPVALREQLQALSDGGWLKGWDSITMYPIDEPGKFGYSDAQTTQIVTSIHQLGLDVPGLAGVHVGVFYGCDDPKPGIKAYDRVGCFRYGGNGCARLEGDYAALRSQLGIAAKLWMIPGGALINGKDGHQDPACWASYAHRNLDVWGVIAFMWQGGADPNNTIVGIRDQLDMRTLYCEMGRVILKPDAEPRC